MNKVSELRHRHIVKACQKYKGKSVRDYQSCKLDKPFVSQRERKRARLGGDISSSGTDARKAVNLFPCPLPSSTSEYTYFFHCFLCPDQALSTRCIPVPVHFLPFFQT